MIFLSCVLFALFFPMIVVFIGLKIMFSLFEKGIDKLLDLIFGLPERLIDNITGGGKTGTADSRISKKSGTDRNSRSRKSGTGNKKAVKVSSDKQKKKKKKPIKVISKK